MSWKAKKELNATQMIEKLQERLVMKYPHCKAHGNAAHLFERELPVGSVVRFTFDGNYTEDGAVHATEGMWYIRNGGSAFLEKTPAVSTYNLRRHMDEHKYDWAHIQ